MGEGRQAAGRPCTVTRERIHAVKPRAGDSRWQEAAAEHQAPSWRQGSDRFSRSRLSPECLQTLRKRRSRPPLPLGLGHDKSTFLRGCSLTCEMRGQTETSGTFLALKVVSWWLNLQDTFPERKGLRWDWVLLLSPSSASRTNPREGGLRLRALSLTKPLLTLWAGPSLTCLAC